MRTACSAFATMCLSVAAAAAVTCRAGNGTWPWELVKVGEKKTKYSPYLYLVSKLNEHGLRNEQEQQQFIARCVADMRLHLWTKEARKGRPDFAYTAQPFRYKYGATKCHLLLVVACPGGSSIGGACHCDDMQAALWHSAEH